MKKYIFFSLTLIQLSCSSNDFIVSVLPIDKIFNDIKKNNYSKLILINVWSTWCAPCIEEFPFIVDLERKYSDKNLNVVFLSTDWDENDSEVKFFLKEQNVKGQHYRKIEGDDEKFINYISPSWSGVMPFTAIYDKNFNLLSFWEGKRNENFFNSKIDSLLSKKG